LRLCLTICSLQQLFTKMPRKNEPSLWNALRASGDLSQFIFGVDAWLALGDLVRGSALSGPRDELRGRCVLVSTTEQITTALALIELDGVARRIVLYPPDLPLEHLPFVMDAAGVEALVSDRTIPGPNIPRVAYAVTCSSTIVPGGYDRRAGRETEWVLLTSGTTGQPKLVVHTLASLTGAIEPGRTKTVPVVWSTFYDIRRYGGLQILLRSLLTGTSLVLSDAREATADFLDRAGSHGVTHISGTPSHWRRALMSPMAPVIEPRYIRLSGEIADQAILNHLRSFYPQAQITHAFASTEAGVAFEVTDGFAGFPADLIEDTPGVDMKVENHSLRIRSNRTATRYLGSELDVLKDIDGFVDTGDILELRGNRYYFMGRRDGTINVGGLKVHPEKVEAVINRHPEVEISLVRTRKSPITGAIVVADVVLKTVPKSSYKDLRQVQDSILQLCRGALPLHEVPAAIIFVPELLIAETGKLVRCRA
jgi:acyl-coenzyme A synthetase/AMP-(fatty) acid ligase